MPSTKGTLFWAPRVLTILFACFISIFALDVFSGTRGLAETIIALLIHLIPTALVIVLLILAWRWELLGTFAFTALAVAYVVMTWGRFPVVTYLAISGPLLLIALLFFVSWRWGTPEPS